MSCCHDCAQTGGDCGSGMAGLMGALVAKGSEVKLGFAYNLQISSEDQFQGYGDPNWIQSVLQGALSDLFEYASIVVTAPAYAGFQDGYILVQGVLFVDVPYIGEIQNTVKSRIQEYLPQVLIQRDDAIHVLSVPQNRSDAVQPFDPTKTAVQQGACNWDTQSFGDYFACQLGITSPIGGVGAGAIGGIAAAGLLALVAIVVLKRF